MSENDTGALFGGLTIERSDEALPKRIVAGRESIPNPFIDAVKDSHTEAKAQGPDKAVRAIYVPVDAKGTTVRTVARKDKSGKATATQWQQHENVNTALYLLRQAAIKNDVGVRIVVDYDDTTVPSVTAKVDDKQQTFQNVTLHKFHVPKSGERAGRVRIRFVGQDKKKAKPKPAPEANAQ
jgi:hypothetical protein